MQFLELAKKWAHNLWLGDKPCFYLLGKHMYWSTRIYMPVPVPSHVMWPYYLELHQVKSEVQS